MSASLSTIKAQAEGLLATELGEQLPSAGWSAAVSSALLQHSRSYPLERVEKIEGAGSFDLALDGATPAVSAWVDKFSQILEIIFPYDDTEQNPDPLEIERYGVIRTDTGLFLRFRADTPAAGQYILISYTAPHLLTESSCSLTDTEADAFADLLASHACMILAAKYIQETDSTLQADTVDRRTKSQECRTQAKAFRDQYGAKLASQADKATGIAAPFRSNFATLVGPREDLFFHGRVYR